MKPVTQTRTIPPGSTPETLPPDQCGNCLAACVASILEVELREVDVLFDDAWWERMFHACWHNGHVLEWHAPDRNKPAPSGYAIAVGKSPRGISHAVVVLDGEFVHDPHPDGGWINHTGEWVTLTPIAEWQAAS